MITAAEVREIALSFEGMTVRPHFDREAFKAARIFATMIPGDVTCNLLLTPPDQAYQCRTHPLVFSPIPNKWGLHGWTVLDFDHADLDLAQSALHAAWLNGIRK